LNTSHISTLQPHTKAMRLLCLLVALTAGLSLLYGIQYYAGGPLRLAVTSEVYDLALSPDGNLVAAGTRDGMIRLWDIADDWSVRTLTGHTGPVTSVAFSSSDATLFSAGHDGTARLWSMSSGQAERVMDAGDGPLNDLAMAADGSILATIGKDGVVRVWDAEMGQVVQSIGPNENTKLAVALSPDGTLVAAGDGENIQTWDARTGESLQRLEGRWEDEEKQETWLGHLKEVTAMAFSPDGAYLASGDAEGATLIWDIQQGQVAWMTKGHLGMVEDIEFDATGQYVLSGGRDNYLRRWRVPGGKFAGLFKGHFGSVTGVTFGPDEDTVLSGGTDGSVRLWESINNQELHLVWTQVGLMPVWGKVLATWMLGSGLLGLLLTWGLWRVRTWSYLGSLALYVVGPLFTVVLPLLETTAYPITWSIRLNIAWPLIGLLVWYVFLAIYLLNDTVAIPYQAPGAQSLAQQLMAARRSQEMRQGILVLATWVSIFILLFSVLRRFGLDLAFMNKWLPFIMEGASLTMFVSAAAILLATILALVGALSRLSNNPLANGISGFYISLIRGTPLLVQIFVWYLALPQLGITLDATVAGILALGVNYGAYMTEIFRAGIQAIGKGQREAAQALGMSASQTLHRIVLPQAIRIVIPPIGNEFIAMMKDSALVSVMGVWELTFRAQKIGRQNFRNLETFIIAAAFYWILTIIFQFFQGKLEGYMARGERE
jgi:polar amino acid transport system permease protein